MDLDMWTAGDCPPTPPYSPHEKQQVDIVEERITNKVHRVTFKDRTKRNLLTYALNNPNCVIRPKCKWRCTCYAEDFTVNMFRWGVWVLATKEDSIEKVYQMVETHFGERPVEVDVQNKTMIFGLGVKICLDDLYDRLFATRQPHEGIVLMDRERFPAMICKLNLAQNITMEVYHKGYINATGMKTDHDVECVRNFIRERIIPLI